MELFNWQEEAYNIWWAKHEKGTIKAPTGVGKTMVGLKVLELNKNDKCLVVVPTVALQEQWISEIRRVVGVEARPIGGVISSDVTQTNVYVAVINSLRDMKLDFDVVILDEVHRYASDENFRPIKSSSHKKILGLSATPERDDGLHQRLKDICPIIFEYKMGQAVMDGTVSEYIVRNIPVMLELERRHVYSNMTEQINRLMGRFGYDFHMAKRSMHLPEARELTSLVAQRKIFLAGGENKIERVLRIINANEGEKIIVFSEDIATIEKIEMHLKPMRNTYVYHSNISKKEKENVIGEFRSSHNGVLLTVRALDEGLNVPTVRIGIIVSGSSSVRQFIQRLGRILRKRDDGSHAILYQLYYDSTKELEWVKKRMSKR